MQLPQPAQRLKYSVQPDKVPYSAGADRRSIVALTITAVNDSPEPADCPRLRIVIPSATIDQRDTLTTDPTTFAVDVGEATPWAIATSGDGECHAVPLPPATGLAPGGSADFVIADIAVNTVPGPVEIRIYQADDRDPAIVVVTKDRPATEQGAAPRIARFDVTPAQIALGGEVTIEWEVTGAQSCTLAPGPVALPSPEHGTARLPVTATTDFTITALGPGGAARQTRTVTVAPVKIDEFTAVPPGPVAPGQPVELRWRTRFAASASIDHGIGPVGATGSVTVTVPATTVYTLVAAGLDQAERSLTVEVGA